MRSLIASISLIGALIGCDGSARTEMAASESSLQPPSPLNANAQSPEFSEPPDWTLDAIWYQIFVERFYNGDTSNDPRLEDIQGSYPGIAPTSWHITPWTQDWYQLDDYAQGNDLGKDFYGNEINSFNQKSAWRRYGGDLAGVRQKLDYIQALGVTAIYFNPLNDAPSLHKYDAASWHHIDRNFGPNPTADVAMMDEEDPLDSDNWIWTSADRDFIELVAEFHQRDIRVIMDFSWNHTGINFWAWQDVLLHQSHSEFADWYWVKQFDNPETDVSEFEYRGWLGVHSLPEIRETEYADHSERTYAFEGNIFSEAAKAHIFAVASRWLDPDGDGDPSDGVDGFRLDVAAELPLGFWREFRAHVRSINPEAYLIGEVWWEKFPHELLDPKPYLQGDLFDAHMNYRWYRIARQLIASAPDELAISAAVSRLEDIKQGISTRQLMSFMNMSASHDSPRLSTSLYNDNLYKFDASPAPDRDYKVERPNDVAFNDVRLLITHQFSYIGAPQIWAGDEMGMWGADDPHTRKPLIWPEFEFDPEVAHPFGEERPHDEVRFDESLHRYYQQLAALRNQRVELRRGELEHVLIDGSARTWGYRRWIPGQLGDSYVVFNLAGYSQEIELPLSVASWQYQSLLSDIELEHREQSIVFHLPPRSSLIISSDGP
ncbi:alpha-amylase family glycosyl hydrolase [Umboniibacter marinipuniceus]|uniref:Glycosidase n=1 Tax=Umboniibacter marinipuniceus TaxID=569599 RepID=A0A3M0AMP6_9GAMM|nr:alpha-amylase family glycosyl hydrolase [Umboniibacter marinipuniceus]RMA80272.1 glycosidase [Umboniibacter marinipuniceus]